MLPGVLLVCGIWGLVSFDSWGRTEIFAEFACFALAALGFAAPFWLPYTCRACKKPFGN